MRGPLVFKVHTPALTSIAREGSFVEYFMSFAFTNKTTDWDPVPVERGI